jgi:hypothetical protein
MVKPISRGSIFYSPFLLWQLSFHHQFPDPEGCKGSLL